jgi:putative heme utilization carrier protein HutX
MTSEGQTPTADELTALRVQLARNPGGILESLAGEHGVPLRTVIECLPRETWSTAAGIRFCEVLDDVVGWGPVTVIVHTPDGVFEWGGPLPPGTLGRGYFNLQGQGGLTGHLRPDRCHSIVFLRRPFMGKQTASIQFLNPEGQAMFKIFVGRDATGELRADALARFEALERRLTTSSAA